MIAIRVFGINVRIHAALITMTLLAALVSGPAAVAAGVLSVLAHEAGHALAAKLCRAQISEIELMPFGAAARIDDMHGLSALKSVAVALAGPVASAVICAASPLFPSDIAPVIRRVNFSVAAFNLLPALPLDGGRAVSRLLSAKLSARTATGVCIASGRVIAVIMLVIAAAGLYATGRINATYVMSAVYILMSGKRERIAAGGGVLLGMLDRKKNIADAGALPVKWLAATESTRFYDLLALFRSGCVHRVAVYDENMRLKGVLEEDMILNSSLGPHPATVGEMLA